MTSICRCCLAYLFDFWISSKLGQAMSVLLASALQHFQPPSASTTTTTTSTTKRPRLRYVADIKRDKSMESFAREAKGLLEAPFHPDRMLAMSAQLQQEYREKLQSSDISMLPSYQHTLPTGNETGDFLALDVGGSTMRVALVRLAGAKAQEGEASMQVRRIRSVVIDKRIRDLRGQEFFDWMAERIGDMLAEYNHMNGTRDALLQMGLAWSFPIEQTSPRSGKLLPMGKGFRATHGVEGEDLSELVMKSCRARGLNVEMKAIVNDGAATLLSQAYRDPSTRMSLILGTGMNAAVYLPVTALGPGKFGSRPATWHAAAHHVLVNTELSMFGKHILPTTRWDDDLNAHHLLPDFQPLEYLVTGRYLGEILRLILLEAVSTAGLFGGELPAHLEDPYALDTRLLADFQLDTSPSLSAARASFLHAHPFRSGRVPRTEELKFLRDLSKLIADRAAVYLAVALHALWVVRTDAESFSSSDDDDVEAGVDDQKQVTIACNGTIVEKYPGFRAACQGFLDRLCSLSSSGSSSSFSSSSSASPGGMSKRAGVEGHSEAFFHCQSQTSDGAGHADANADADAKRKRAVTLEMAPESSIFGAAVAVSCLRDTA
ncbi:hexokinase-1 [Hortaea werneckii]|nr:hexokinase-1 [Hortaea werneckii]KAI7203194.1 hexokinase-1 [Hortaea werneckii]